MSRAKAIGAGLESTYAGQDDPVCRAHHISIGGDGHIRAHRFERVVNRMEITRAIIDECDDFSHGTPLALRPRSAVPIR